MTKAKCVQQFTKKHANLMKNLHSIVPIKTLGIGSKYQ